MVKLKKILRDSINDRLSSVMQELIKQQVHHSLTYCDTHFILSVSWSPEPEDRIELVIEFNNINNHDIENLDIIYETLTEEF